MSPEEERAVITTDKFGERSITYDSNGKPIAWEVRTVLPSGTTAEDIANSRLSGLNGLKGATVETDEAGNTTLVTRGS